jgi:hypothetical protein
MKLHDFAGPVDSKSLDAELADIEKQIAARTAALARASADWEVKLRASADVLPQAHVLDLLDFESADAAVHRVLPDKSVLLVDEPPDTDVYTFSATTDLKGITAFKLEALTDDSLPGGGPGRGDPLRPNFVVNSFIVEASPRGNENFVPVRFVKAVADFSQTRFGVAGAIDDDPKTGWAIGPRFFVPHWAQFQTGQPVGFENGTTLRFRVVQNSGIGRTVGRIRVSAITGNPDTRGLTADIARIVSLPDSKRSKADRASLERFRLDQDGEIVDLRQKQTKLKARIKILREPTSLVMQELAQPRQSHVFSRGDFRQPAESVVPGVPAVLHPYSSAKSDRLALARWLVDRRNPLTARVTVNRWWAELFGHGIVETVEDFGMKGQPPSHPELLDWLAVEFTENGWSMKHVLREIVTSATYRQSSKLTPELLARDDKNELYAREPRVRMDAEMIRDNALAISGLLSKKQFGPSVRPYQPDGIWIKVGGQRFDYEVSPGEDRYRRGIYVVLKRGSPYPSFVNFDATARLACTAKRSRSNTPLQALTLLNDPVYVEAAQALAERVLKERPKASVGDRITHMFRLCVGRMPKSTELDALQRLYDKQSKAAQRDPAATQDLIGSLAIPNGVKPAELAAWYAVATALLNLDETITKG